MSSFAGAERLARVLGERGLRSRWSVRVGVHPMRLDKARTALMERTGMDSRRARTALEQRQVVIEGVSLAAARRDALELQGADAYAWIEHAITELYAHGPTSRTQPCEWLSLLGRTLILARGRPWDWGPIEVLIHEGQSLALARAIDVQRQRWAEEGLTEVDSELALLSGISSVHEPFETALQCAPDEAAVEELATVYADWLQDRGDPRGVVGSAALHDPQAGLERALESHATQVLGPLPRWLWRGLRWVGPLIIEARLPQPLHPDDVDARPRTLAEANTFVETLLALPAATQLRTLDLDRDYAQLELAESVLARAPCRLSLRDLALRNLPPRPTPLDLTWSMPQLERLRLSVHAGVLLGRFPRLRSLAIEIETLMVRVPDCFSQFEAPMLREFGLAFGAWGIDMDHALLIEQLRELFTLPPFAELRVLRLGLHSRHAPVEADFVYMLRDLPCRASLECLDLRALTLSEIARETLEAHRSDLPKTLIA